MTTYRMAYSQREAVEWSNAGETVYTIVSSPEDGSLWYSRALWRDATYAWSLVRHVGDGFYRLPDDMRPLFADIESFMPGENAMYVPHPVATSDANGNDLMYPGPDGTTLYFRGSSVGTAANRDRIRRENKIGEWRER
jgi:hypothetical protein